VTTSTEPAPRRTRVRRRRAAVGVLVLIVVLVAVVAGGALLASRLLGGPADYSGEGSGSVTVTVEPGDSATAIGQTLEQAGVVASTEAFVAAARADDRSLGIQPGSYDMRETMSAQAALGRLLDPAARIETDVTIPEGLRLGQVVDLLVAATGLPRSDFEQALGQPQRLGLPPYAEGDAEGFLFPATYTFSPTTSARQILRTMVRRFDQAAADVDLVRSARAVNLTPRQAVTVASLVQAEVSETDFGKAARVVYNRLNTGMLLQFDSTVNYALGSDDLTLTNDQLSVDSPYNTYKYPGLPPGPINSSGEAALRAALNPPDGDWLYFVAVAPGSDQTRFTADYDQFLRWKDEFYAAVNGG
jgi:UPF0755 protein